jgi:hypothetical protein
VLDADAGDHFAGSIDAGRRRQLAGLFQRIREQSGLSSQQRDELVSQIVAAMNDLGQR